ncbi:OLC1v1019119C1 [Oldenlandia corymbosa var. corymbosa]|uniref:OLC1v1019119C1 n=1 Tax=Oldenlandia corymbosa var. corymbosa TaxID=529605 RepID=A0AAV1ED63_OLDCO|nr:OLC1v1019119C1 [Oldenlandia corymbosa var. corymbosa]
MGMPQDSSSGNPPVFVDRNPADVNDDLGKDLPWKKMGKEDDEQQKEENQEDYSFSESSPVLDDNNSLGCPELFALYDPDDVLEEEEDDDGSKIVLYDSEDQWDEDYVSSVFGFIPTDYGDEYGYGPKIPPGYQRIPALPPGFENAYLRHYNHDLCCYDDEYDSDCQLQKALFESILVLESSYFNPGSQVRESFSSGIP